MPDSQENQNANRPRNIGGLWIRRNPEGEEYFFGRITVDGKTYDFTGLENKSKNDERIPAEKRAKYPDISLFPPKPKAAPKTVKKEENPL